MNGRKIFFIIFLILFVLGVGFALYWVFFRGTPPSTGPGGFNAGQIPDVGPGNLVIVNDVTNNATNGLPWQQYLKDKVSPVATGGLTSVKEISDGDINGVTSGANGVQFYDKKTNQFYRIDKDGKLVAMSDQKFYQVQNITWDSSNGKAILEYPDGSNILYNFRSNRQVTLPAELENFSFSADGSQISAKWMGANDEDNWLVAANDDGSGMFLIEPIGDQSYNTSVSFSPDNQIAAIYYKHYDAQRQEVFPIGLHGENFKSFVVDGSGFEYKWSPQGDRMVYSVYNDATDYNPNLWVTQGGSGQLGDTKVSVNLATWPDKCTFSSSDRMICAVPQGLPRGAGLYPEIADTYPDNFYSVDLKTGVKSLVASPVGSRGSYAAYNLSISADGSTLYFVDKKTGTLQSVKLK